MAHPKSTMEAVSDKESSEKRKYPEWYPQKGEKKTFDSNNPPKFGVGQDLEDEVCIKRYDVKRSGNGKRGLAIIMTNDFEDKNAGQDPLRCVFKDAEMLWTMFEHFNFDVKWHANSKATEMLDNLEKDLKKDVNNMIVCCISSHGNEMSILGQDGDSVTIKDIVGKLDDFESKLLGKPKLFFIDACQGKGDQTVISKGKDPKHQVDTFYRVTRKSDILVGFAAYQGTVSYGDTTGEGSVYTTELVRYWTKFHKTEDIETILKAVCGKVQQEKLEKGKEDKAQLPILLTTLTKKLIFSDE